MVEAPERIRVAQDAEGFWTCREAISGSQEYTRSDIAERQIEELRAELSSAMKAADEYAPRALAAEAENARLRALPLKDEVERVLESFAAEAAEWSWKFQDEQQIACLPGPPHHEDDVAKFTVGHLRAARSLLSRLRAGEQEGWRPIETAPTNKAILIHLPNTDYYGNDGVYAAMLVDMGTGKRWMTFGWAIGRDCGPENIPDGWQPLPAAPAEQGGDRG